MLFFIYMKAISAVRFIQYWDVEQNLSLQLSFFIWNGSIFIFLYDFKICDVLNSTFSSLLINNFTD